MFNRSCRKPDSQGVCSFISVRVFRSPAITHDFFSRQTIFDGLQRIGGLFKEQGPLLQAVPQFRIDTLRTFLQNTALRGPL